MWSKKRQTVGFTPRKLRASCVMKKRPSTMSSEKTVSNIKVVVRVRPLNRRDSGSRQVVKVLDDSRLVFDPKEDQEAFYVGGHKQLNRDMLKKRRKNQEMEFDKVFHETTSNQEVFEGSTMSLVTSLLEGYNCSVFVYGATGAGKTYTMLGSKDTPGIAYLTMVELYNKINFMEKDFAFDIRMSYLEVYNEMVKDLINPSGPLSLRDDGKNGIIVSGIQTQQINSADELFSLLDYGNKNRTQHPTDANAESSRSHAVFQVNVRMTDKLSAQVKVAKLTMIDLAGSERGAATGGKGLRFCEGSNINKSLLALGNCVDALAEGQKHIPYRNSKLTRILKDSLGGNCRTVMIVNVSPSPVCYEETFNTLHYASRAKKINTKARRNLISTDLPVSQYKKIIEDLRLKVDELEHQLQNQPLETNSAAPPEQERPTSKDILRARNAVKTGYEEEAAYYKELHMYRIKIKTLQFRIHKKKAISGKLLALTHGRKELEENLARTDKSMERFEMQILSYKEKVKMIKRRIYEKQKVRQSAFEALEKEGLLKELQRDIDHYSEKMKQEELKYRLEYYEGILKMQENEDRSKDKIITTLMQTVDYYYSLLLGYKYVTQEMESAHMQLITHLYGVKEVTWEDNPDNYSTLQRLLDFSYNSDSDKGSPELAGSQPPAAASAATSTATATTQPAADRSPSWTASLPTTPRNASLRSEADHSPCSIPATPGYRCFVPEADVEMDASTPTISTTLNTSILGPEAGKVNVVKTPPLPEDFKFEPEADDDDVCITLPPFSAMLNKPIVESNADTRICSTTSNMRLSDPEAGKELCPSSISATASNLALNVTTDMKMCANASSSSPCPVEEFSAKESHILPNPCLENTFVVDSPSPSKEPSSPVISPIAHSPLKPLENLRLEEKSFLPVPLQGVSNACLNETYTAKQERCAGQQAYAGHSFAFPKRLPTNPVSQPGFLAPLPFPGTSKVVSAPRCIIGLQKNRKIRLVPPPQINKENVPRVTPKRPIPGKHLLEKSASKEVWSKNSLSSGQRKKSPPMGSITLKVYPKGGKSIPKPLAIKTTMSKITPVVNSGGVQQ